jgi:hypothetical protein
MWRQAKPVFLEADQQWQIPSGQKEQHSLSTTIKTLIGEIKQARHDFASVAHTNQRLSWHSEEQSRTRPGSRTQANTASIERPMADGGSETPWASNQEGPRRLHKTPNVVLVRISASSNLLGLGQKMRVSFAEVARGSAALFNATSHITVAAISCTHRQQHISQHINSNTPASTSG